jgi:hypothetical protein
VRQEQFRAVVFLDVDPAQPPDELVVTLTPADPVRGRVLDPDGKPLIGARGRGLLGEDGSLSQPLPTAEFEASPLRPGRSRFLYFRHTTRKLAGVAGVSKAGAGPVDVTLRPWGSVTGRVLEANGSPAGHAVAVVFVGETGPDGKAIRTLVGLDHFTRQDGTFRIDGLIPGVRYDLKYYFKEDRREGTIARGAEVKAGETKDLGTIRMPAK